MRTLRVMPMLRTLGHGVLLGTLAFGFLTPFVEAQTFTVLYSFAGGSDGKYPTGSLIRDSAGNLYGTTSAGGGTEDAGTVFRIDPSGNETVLYSFGPEPDGQGPTAGLVRDKAGNFYGTTIGGGGEGNAGTVFKLSDKLHERVLHRFHWENYGNTPRDTLIIDAAGNLYGTTAGTVFEIDPSGEMTTLHVFSSRTDGKLLESGVVRDSEGNLYGTTFEGGTFKRGTVFMLNADGLETVLYNFSKPPNSVFPFAGLYRDASRNLFGATLGGGKSKLCDPGCGTVFKITKDGTESVLYSFTGLADGASPYGGLVEDKSRNLYGTTFGGGDPACSGGGGCGTVFRLNQRGAFTTLHAFSGPDGANPFASVLLDPSGNVYGTSLYGGASNYGVVFKLTP